MLGLHLEVPLLRGRIGPGLVVGEKGNENEIGGVAERKEVAWTEEVDTSNRVRIRGNSGRVRKDRADQKIKTKT